MKTDRNFTNANEPHLPTLLKPKRNIVNEVNFAIKNLDGPRTWTAELRTQVCKTLDLSERSICAAVADERERHLKFYDEAHAA